MACTEQELEREEAKAKLLIRSYNGDTGVEEIPSGQVWWLSPDLRLSHPAATDIDEGTTRDGVVTTVQVNVTNISGVPVSDINVEAWVCDFATVPVPRTPPGRLTGYFPGPLADKSSQVIGCSPAWTPTSADEGHHCLLGNTWSETPAYGNEVGAAGLGILKPPCNPRHAQRNIAVLAKSISLISEGDEAVVEIFVNNILERDAEFRVFVREAEGANALTLVEREQLASGNLAEKLELGRAKERIAGRRKRPTRQRDRPCGGDPWPRLRSRDKMVLAGTRIPLVLSPLRTRALELESRECGSGEKLKIGLTPLESHPVKLRIGLDPDEQPGSVHVYDVVQANARTGSVIGAARMVLLVTRS